MGQERNRVMQQEWMEREREKCKKKGMERERWRWDKKGIERQSDATRNEWREKERKREM